MQSDFSKELFKACKAQGWHTAIETTGYANSETIEEVFPYIDLVLMDIKSTNLELHRKYTGVSNEIILNNAKRISEISKMVIRVPLIPDFNSSMQDILELCRFTKTLNNIDTIHLLPYHTYGENKYELLGRNYLMKDSRSLKEDEIEVLKKIIEDQGIKCIIGG